MKRFRYIVLSLLLLELFNTASGQSFYALRRERNLIVSAGSGVSRYYGELVNPGQVGKVRMNVNFGAEYFITNRLSARTDVTWFQLSGSDELANDSRVKRNLSFFSNNVEVNVTGAFQLFPNQKNFYQRPYFNIYGFGGIGLLYFNPKTIYNGEVIALQPLQTEGKQYSRFQIVIPMGIGVKLKVNPWTNIAIEGGYRETFTDYLDDISSRNYPDPSTLPGGATGLSALLSDRRKELDPNYNVDYTKGIRGNPTKQDSYFILTVKAQFYIPTNFGSNKKLYNSKRKSYYKKPKRGLGGMFKAKKRKPGRRR